MNDKNKINKLEREINFLRLDIQDARNILGSIGHEGLLLTAMRVIEERNTALKNWEAWMEIALREIKRNI